MSLSKNVNSGDPNDDEDDSFLDNWGIRETYVDEIIHVFHIFLA